MPPIVYLQVVSFVILVGVYRLAARVVEDWAEHRKHQRKLAEQIQAANIRTLEGWKPPALEARRD